MKRIRKASSTKCHQPPAHCVRRHYVHKGSSVPVIDISALFKPAKKIRRLEAVCTIEATAESSCSDDATESDTCDTSGKSVSSTSSNSTEAELRISLLSNCTLLVVLDLDETIVCGRRGRLWIRPGTLDLLSACIDAHCEVIVWTAACRTYADFVVHCLDSAIVRCADTYASLKPQAWFGQIICSATELQSNEFECPPAKDISLLRDDLRHIIHIDNNPSSAALHPQNCLLVEDYSGEDDHTNSLSRTADIILALAEAIRHKSSMSVSVFLDQCSEVAKCKLKHFSNRENQEEKYVQHFILAAGPALRIYGGVGHNISDGGRAL